MIVSFGDDATADLYHGKYTHHIQRFTPEIIRTAFRKFDMINAADLLIDLREPPGNRLEALKGDLEGTIVFESMTNGESSFNGKITMRLKYR